MGFEVIGNGKEAVEYRIQTNPLTTDTFALPVPSTCRTTIGDRAFPVAAARAWISAAASPGCFVNRLVFAGTENYLPIFTIIFSCVTRSVRRRSRRTF